MLPASTQQSIFEEGRNCRSVADARRVAFVVDGDDYFKMFMDAAERAQESAIAALAGKPQPTIASCM